MDIRAKELYKLRSYTEEIDKDLTMILQSLQWDRKHILQHPAMVSCKYDTNHKIFTDHSNEHEKECLLRLNGYSRDDHFLPDPLSTSASTLIKLSKEDIAHIIDNAASSDPTFKKVYIDTFHGPKQLCLLFIGSGELEPQTLGRLQCAYSVDERRAIHDAVVGAAPSCHDLADLALPSVGDDDQTTKTKSRTEILAELRDMRRRRTKYRVAAKSRNYSDVLRDVIKTQMEMYNEVLGEVETKPDIIELNANIDKQMRQERNDDIHPKVDNRDKQEYRGEFSRRERDRDSEKYTRERADIDHKNKDDRYQDKRGRRHKHDERSIEKRLDKRHNSHHRPRDIDDNRVYRDKSRDRQRDRSKERGYDARRDRDCKRRERHTLQHDDAQCREHKERNRPKDDRRSKDRDNKEQRDSDTERARNLILEIKRETEHVVKGQDMSYKRDNYKDSLEVNQEKRYREYMSRDDKCHVNNSHTYSEIAHSYKDRSKDRITKEKSGSHKRHKDERGSDLKEHRDKHERHKRNHRDRSYDKEVKRSRVEEKHKTYYEIYAELDSRKHKGNEHDN